MEENKDEKCIFCGALDTLVAHTDGYGKFQVRCINCEARGPLKDDDEEALQAWINMSI